MLVRIKTKNNGTIDAFDNAEFIDLAGNLIKGGYKAVGKNWYFLPEEVEVVKKYGCELKSDLTTDKLRKFRLKAIVAELDKMKDIMLDIIEGHTRLDNRQREIYKERSKLLNLQDKTMEYARKLKLEIDKLKKNERNKVWY